MTGSSPYVIRGGIAGRERLRVLARVMRPTTDALFERVGVPIDAHCLDVGCGGGDVTVALGARAPAGTTVGLDFDEAQIEQARAEAADAGVHNVVFRTGDVTSALDDGERFDLVYARFLLTHLPDPAGAVARLRAWLRSGGALVVEDIDFTAHFCHPRAEAFDRYVGLYTRAVQARGGDPNIGPRLPSLLRDAGVSDLHMHVVQPAGFEGEVRLIAPITLEAIADAAVGAGLTTERELHATIDELYAFVQTPGVVVSLPRIVQVWGRRGVDGSSPEREVR